MDLSLPSNLFSESTVGQMKCSAKIIRDFIICYVFPPGVKELPQTFGDLRALTKLDISRSSMKSLPDSFGDLENLKELNAKLSSLTTLPRSIGMLKKLEILDLEGSLSLEEIPTEIGGLSSLRKLDLSFTAIRQLPSTVIQLSLLQSLKLTSSSLGEPKEVDVNVTDQQERLMDVTVQPVSYADLSQLETLGLYCEHLTCIPVLPSSLRHLLLDGFVDGLEVSNISNTIGLAYLCITCRTETSKYEYLRWFPSSLRELRIFGSVVLPDLSNLRYLRKFVLRGQLVKEIPGLGKLVSLEELDIFDCDSLDSLENLSRLRRLRHLSIFNCPNLKIIEGIDELPLVLRYVHLGLCKCTECMPVENNSSITTRFLNWMAAEIGIASKNIPIRVLKYLVNEESGEDRGTE